MEDMKVFRAYTKALNDYDLDQMQYDALWDLLNDNPLLPSSTVASRNKALKTSKQNIIGAINELLNTINSQDKTVKSFESLLNQALGEIMGSESESWEQLQQIDENVVKAVVRIWYDLGGTMDLSDIGSSIKDIIRSMNNKLNSHEERIQVLEQSIGVTPNIEELVREIPVPVEGQVNVFSLSRTPNEKHVILSVNGIEYDETDEFTVDRENNTLTWTNTDFELDIQEDELDVVYYV